jgi:hypothetical protein
MEGVSKFISYALTILSGFIVLTLLVSLIHGYYNRMMESNIRAVLRQIAAQTASSVVYLYNQGKESNANPPNSSSITLSYMDLNYPDRIGGKNFEVELLSSPGIWNVIANFTINGVNATIRKESISGAKVIAKTTQKPIVSYEYDIPNIPVMVQGRFRSGGNDTLRLVRYNYNGSLQDVIILGESDIIIRITSIS